ncbi:hypothetical protein E2542_SST04561 [Spatholobus suberectus]|nr:hypothetical protein E2542_SST04561 [Spatholobus suberectus]
MACEMPNLPHIIEAGDGIQWSWNINSVLPRLLLFSRSPTLLSKVPDLDPYFMGKDTQHLYTLSLPIAIEIGEFHHLILYGIRVLSITKSLNPTSWYGFRQLQFL